MTTVIQLQEQQQKAWAAYKALAEKRDSNGKFADPTDHEAYRKAGDDLDSFAERITEAQKDEVRQKRMIEADFQDEKRLSESGAKSEDEKRLSYDSVYGRWLTRAQNATLSPEEMRVLETRGTNTQITTTNSLGGYLVPQSFSNQLEAMGLWSGGMMENCQIQPLL